MSKLKVQVLQTLKLADLETLGRLGVNIARYSGRDYTRTQEIADVAYFLGFDGLIAPSARWKCLNFVLFTDRLSPEHLHVVETSIEPVRWGDWRKKAR